MSTLTARRLDPRVGFWEFTWLLIRCIVIVCLMIPVYAYPGMMVGWFWYDFSQWALTLPWYVDFILVLLLFVRKKNWWKFIPLYLYIPVTVLRATGIVIPFKTACILFGAPLPLVFFGALIIDAIKDYFHDTKKS